MPSAGAMTRLTARPDWQKREVFEMKILATGNEVAMGLAIGWQADSQNGETRASTAVWGSLDLLEPSHRGGMTSRAAVKAEPPKDS